MATDVTIVTGNTTLTLKSAQDSTTGTRLNLFNMMTAIGAYGTKDYEAQLNKHLDLVKQDIEDLEDYQAYKTYVEGWTKSNWRDLSHFTPGKGYSPSHIFDALGVDVTSYTREGRHNQPLQAYYYFQDERGRPNAAHRDYPPISIPENFSQVTATGPASTQLPNNDEVVYESDDGKLFIRRNDKIWPVNDVRLIVDTVTDADVEALRGLTLKVLKDKTEQASQGSQSKQAYLQELMGRYNAFYSFTNNTSGTAYSDKRDILNRFS